MFVACYRHLPVFFEYFIHKHFSFFKKNVEKMKKSEHFGNFWFKKKTGKCQKHETNMILCLLHATDIYQFFLKILLINTSLFSKKMLKKRKKSEHFGNFWFKKKTCNCPIHETNMILCLLHATDIYQFFFEYFTHKHFTFFKKNEKKVNILVIFGSKKNW